MNCLSIAEVVNMDIGITSNDEFMRGGGCVGKNDENWLRKVEKGCEYGDEGVVERCRTV